MITYVPGIQLCQFRIAESSFLFNPILDFLDLESNSKADILFPSIFRLEGEAKHKRSDLESYMKERRKRIEDIKMYQVKVNFLHNFEIIHTYRHLTNKTHQQTSST